MRKPSLNETIVIAFSLYMVFTLSIDTKWMYTALEEDPDSMYAMYLELLGSQPNIAVFSGVVAGITIAALFVQHYLIRIASNLIGLVYFSILSASFIFSYPNLGLGLSAIFVVIMLVNINRLIDEHQDERKKKIMEDSYCEGGEEDDAERTDTAGSTETKDKESKER